VAAIVMMTGQRSPVDVTDTWRLVRGSRRKIVIQCVCRDCASRIPRARAVDWWFIHAKGQGIKLPYSKGKAMETEGKTPGKVLYCRSCIEQLLACTMGESSTRAVSVRQECELAAVEVGVALPSHVRPD
jgi:hypothetical protein